MLTADDYQNMRVFLDRVQTTGVTEAKVLAVLANKIDLIRQEIAEAAQITEENDGEDASSTDE